MEQARRIGAGKGSWNQIHRLRLWELATTGHNTRHAKNELEDLAEKFLRYANDECRDSGDGPKVRVQEAIERLNGTPFQINLSRLEAKIHSRDAERVQEDEQEAPALEEGSDFHAFLKRANDSLDKTSRTTAFASVGAFLALGFVSWLLWRNGMAWYWYLVAFIIPVVVIGPLAESDEARSYREVGPEVAKRASAEGLTQQQLITVVKEYRGLSKLRGHIEKDALFPTQAQAEERSDAVPSSPHGA